MKLKNKVVLITGSSSGIGEATAKLFASEGARIVVNCKNNVKKGEKVVSEIELAGGQALFVQADVSKDKDVDKLFAAFKKKFGTLDILINNAGVTRPKVFAETTYQDWLSEFNDNFFGTVLCSQRAAKIMLAQKKGKKISSCSCVGRTTLHSYSAIAPFGLP